MVAASATTREAVLPLGSIVIVTMAAVGGCWWPIDLEPRWMRSVALAFPTTPVPPRTELAVAADRTVHHVRLARLDLAIADAEAIGGARREVLDHHVRFVHQFPEDLLGLEGRDVEQ